MIVRLLGVIIPLVFCHLVIPTTSAQDPAEKWEKAIAKFEAADRKNQPKKGTVLFLGSSSIRGWDLKKWFPDHPYINRGFGGSQISDSIYFFDRLVTPYQPKTIVFYAGDNDISKGKSAKIVSEDFRKFAKLTTQALPQTQILFVAIKPSIKRWNLMNKMRVANQMIADFAKSNPKITFIDIDTPMIGSDGKPRQDLFLKDGLHINAKGYQIWSDRVKRELARPVQSKGPKRQP
ncbi:SGNH/GDSL hydrolase family protein [bacterium]|nr:SGNH/GDSL hydrolase family protein [bacterium]